MGPMIDGNFIALKEEAIHRLNLPYGINGKDIKFARLALGMSRITIAYDLRMKVEELKNIEMCLDPVPDYLLDHMKFLLGVPELQDPRDELGEDI
jgi:hypothetical protein